ALQWKVAFTRAGDYVVWSTGGATIADKETLYAIKVDDIAGGAKPATVAAGIARWSIAADSQKVYYLKNYHYPTQDTAPPGDLAMIDFPTGANDTVLVDKVGALQALSDGDVDKGVAFFDTIANGTATYKYLADRTKPGSAVTVVAGIPGVIALSRDLRYLYYFKQTDQDIGTTDGYIIHMDGTGGCNLTTSTLSAQFGAPFTPNGSMVMWVDNIDTVNSVGDAYVANPEGCTNKRKFTDK